MQLSLTDDQAMLAKTASNFFAERSPVSRLRKLRDAGDERGYSQALYREMAELGWTSIPFSEGEGGLGMGLAGAIIVTEAMGRTLTPEPYLPSVLLAGQVLALGANAAQRKTYLEPLINGEKVFALAYEEATSRYDLARVETRAEPAADGGFRLNGRKQSVMAGALADGYLVSARTSGEASARDGISVFFVPADAKGLSVTRQRRIDSRNAAIVELKDVTVAATALIGERDRAYVLLDNAVDRATAALCGEMLGAMAEAFDRTLRYLKERKQFNVLIGSFQALKHRAAKLFIELELARSATLLAARALDENQADAKALVSVAKARCSDAYVLAANEAVQLHGGIGMTDEHEIGFFIKHARVCELTFGDAAFHRDRFARLSGY
ncbi:MAG TPA: acyl-CoA dehydrogenase family protein [Polyangiales bacterium]